MFLPGLTAGIFDTQRSLRRQLDCVPLALPVLFLDSRGHWQSQWHTHDDECGSAPFGCGRRQHCVFAISANDPAFEKRRNAVRQGRNPTGCYRTWVRVAPVGRSISCRENNIFAVSSAESAKAQRAAERVRGVDVGNYSPAVTGFFSVPMVRIVASSRSPG